MKFRKTTLAMLIALVPSLRAQTATVSHPAKSVSGENGRQRATTFCNPLNLDYTYQITESDKEVSYRSGADPAVVEFRGDYYMFVTRSLGYWHSKDLTKWQFIRPQRWYFQG